MTALKILAVLLLVAANAFFVAAEFGMVAVRRTRIEELASHGSRRALSAQKALKELNLILSGCQLGITFASLGLGAIGEPALAHLFEGAFDALPPVMATIATHSVAVVISFAIITFLHVVLGELVPKNLAIARPESTALWVAGAMRFFTFLFRPLIWLFNEAANATLRMVKVTSKGEIASIHTPDELAIIIAESALGGAIEEEHRLILTRTLEFPEKRAVEAMVPRIAAESVAEDATLEELLDLSERTGYSRFPVWSERPDEFTGVVHLKDMLKVGRSANGGLVGDAARRALVIPESTTLEDVLIQMRKERNHFAIVIDEFGSTAGILTLEDIIEELVGEIRDEYDVREKDFVEVGGIRRIPGTMRPDEMEELTGCLLPEGDYETVAGFILSALGRLAKRGDEVTVSNYRLRVANVRQRRILSVDIERIGT